MAQLKNLHIGKCLEDLEKLTSIPDLRNRTMKSLLATARKVYMAAEEHRLDGDEEMAYITYMKYFNMLSAIRNKSDYSDHKLTVRQELGDTEANRRIMDTLELITDSLSKRYGQQQLKGTGNARTKAEAAILPPSESIGDGASVTPATAYSQLGVITCETLFQRMQEQSVLVMDCRKTADYDNSHLTYYCAFNVPEELITVGMSAGRLQARLSSSAKAAWASRSIKDSVVLMDWNSKDAPPAGNTPIGILLDILKNWDPDVTYRAPIQIVDGGYEYFIMMYPTHCTNPSVQAPQQNNNDIETIDDIEYPSIHDITMKEDVMNARDYKNKSKPSINRASKQAALRTYRQNSQHSQLTEEQQVKPITEIIRSQESLLERGEHNDILLDNAFKKWKSIFDQRSPEQGPPESASELELLYTILQLESKAEDIKIENIRLRDELNSYKAQQQQQQLQNEAETTRRIEFKIQERQLLDAQHERDSRERERQLIIARKSKPHYKPPAESATTSINRNATTPNKESPPSSISEQPPTTNDDSVTNSLPVYDRTTKPQSKPVETIVQRVRDFSPVVGHKVGRGLTGLKNLGNTCYMNSILQCLSNTPQLMEFCVSGKYKSHICRKNKTNGEVIEEVAALIKELWNGQYKCVASRDLRYVVGQYQKIFRGVDQQDSHEFLTILMDWLHSDLQTLQVPRQRETITAPEKAWLDFTKSQESLILHLFYGQMKSTVKCVTCNKESATYECFSNLSLELPANSSMCYLNECMDMYFSGEKIHGWNCPNCKTKRDAIKKLDISKLPPVLVVHLKRFYAHPHNSGAYIKKQDYLDFPLENLEMTPYIARAVSRAMSPKIYQLYAVSNHYGSMESGHYTAFCKSVNYGRWFKYDDQVVSPLDATNVVSSAAYILFYTWLPPMPLSVL